jgi:hypothetical protein
MLRAPWGEMIGGCAQCRHGQRMVVLSAVEERDLRLRKSDACRERLGRRRTAVMCLRRGGSGYGSLPRLPVDPFRRRKRYCRGIEEAEVCARWWM